jgi:hypothetical protein
LFSVRRLLSNILSPQCPYPSLNLFDVRINQAINPLLRTLVDARSINSSLNQQRSFSTIKFQELLRVLLELFFGNFE